MSVRFHRAAADLQCNHYSPSAPQGIQPPCKLPAQGYPAQLQPAADAVQLGKLLAELSLPWDTCGKELFWPLTVDGKPMMARVQSEWVAAAPVVWCARGPYTTTGSAQLHRESHCCILERPSSHGSCTQCMSGWHGRQWEGPLGSSSAARGTACIHSVAVG